MINERLGRVMTRIEQIENRFSPNKAQLENGIFANHLQNAEEKYKQPYINKQQNQSYDKNSVQGMLVEAANKYGVDSDLVLSLANAESGYRPDAVSPVGAVGVMQLMPETAKDLGVQNSFDAKQNIDGGVRYLKQMLDMFGGDKEKALAAYNAGPGAVQQYGGIPPYNETQAYVKNILSDINNR